VAIDNENSIELFQKFFGRGTVEIFKDAVVREDLHVLLREDHTEERAAGAGTFSSLIHASCRGAAMVAIRDVEGGSLGETFCERGYGYGIGDGPTGVTDTIFGDEVCVRRGVGRVGQGTNGGTQAGARRRNQEDGTGL